MQVSLLETGPHSLTALAELNNETYQYRNHRIEIPIKILENGATTYHAELCGFEVESDKKDDIPDLVHARLKSLINTARLPDYVFVAKRAQKVIPVYTIGNDVMVSISGGPIFRHEELAVIRKRVTDYLHEIKVLGSEGLSDKLHVRGIDPNDLGLHSPLFYLKKYNINDDRFWAPVFENFDHSGIYTHAADKSRNIPYRKGHEVFEMQTLVAELLISRDRLITQHDLRADRLRPTYWEQVQSHLTPLKQSLAMGARSLETYRYKQTYIAVEAREPEDRDPDMRFGLYFGDSIEDLTERVEIDFKRRALI